jgi:hypothetical protein
VDLGKRKKKVSEKEDTFFYLEDSHLIFPFIFLVSNFEVKWKHESRDLCRSELPHSATRMSCTFHWRQMSNRRLRAVIAEAVG